jgi:hypothetical protein
MTVSRIMLNLRIFLMTILTPVFPLSKSQENSSFATSIEAFQRYLLNLHPLL